MPKVSISLGSLLSACLLLGVQPSAVQAKGRVEGVAAVTATRILDEGSAERLLANKGLTLQWVDWDHRGSVIVTRQKGLWKLHGRQAEPNGPGLLALDGDITEIGADYFIFKGRIGITDTPDVGRSCSAEKTWRFAITQNRRYFRLREFEWCDELTDYIDIYF